MLFFHRQELKILDSVHECLGFLLITLINEVIVVHIIIGSGHMIISADQTHTMVRYFKMSSS